MITIAGGIVIAVIALFVIIPFLPEIITVAFFVAVGIIAIIFFTITIILIVDTNALFYIAGTVAGIWFYIWSSRREQKKNMNDVEFEARLKQIEKMNSYYDDKSSSS